MRVLILAAGIALLAVAPLAAQTSGATPSGDVQDAATGEDPEATRRLNEQVADRLRRDDEEGRRVQEAYRAEVERARLERERFEQSLRDAEVERLRYEAEMERHRAEVARLEAERAEYDRRSGRRGGGSARAPTAAPDAPLSAEDQNCRERSERNRRRGRAVGSVVGGIIGTVAGRDLSRVGRIGAVIASVPVGALLGEAIAGLLDCEEQQQAAVATEQAVEGGVGTTVTWTSESRDNVTGSSTVTAATTLNGDPCLMVTDIVIVEGEETRVSKQLCRRPPSNRFVRV